MNEFFFSWPPFTKWDDYLPTPARPDPFNWSKTHSTGPKIIFKVISTDFDLWQNVLLDIFQKSIEEGMTSGRHLLLDVSGTFLEKGFCQCLRAINFANLQRGRSAVSNVAPPIAATHSPPGTQPVLLAPKWSCILGTPLAMFTTAVSRELFDASSTDMCRHKVYNAF